MSIPNNSWFKYINEIRLGTPTPLAEGLRDIGLPKAIADIIEEQMPDAPEKSRMFMGDLWKNFRTKRFQSLQRNESEFVKALSETWPKDLQSGRRMVDVRPKDVEGATEIWKILVDAIAATSGPYGRQPKALRRTAKLLLKKGAPPEKVAKTVEIFNTLLLDSFKEFWNNTQPIVWLLNDHRDNYKIAQEWKAAFFAEMLTAARIAMMVDQAQEILDNKEDPKEIMHTFDDGSYWYNLQTDNCPIEGGRMGHCGADNRGTLISLRKKKKGRRDSSSYVTMTVGGDTIFQIKGRENDAPPEIMWPHIAWFIDNFTITEIGETGEHSNNPHEFGSMIDWLQANTETDFTAGRLGYDAAMEELEQELDESISRITREFYGKRSDLEYSGIGVSDMEPSDDGGDTAAFHVTLECNYNITINLASDGKQYVDDDLKDIPDYDYDADEFLDESGIKELLYDMPLDSDYDPNASFEIKMLEPYDPNWNIGDPDPEPTAHLVIDLYKSETFPFLTDPAAGVYDTLADDMLRFEEDYKNHVELIRKNLVEYGYMSPSEFDKSSEELQAMDLEHFKVWDNSDDSGGIEFWFRTARNKDNTVPSGIVIPSIVTQYIYDRREMPGENRTNRAGRPSNPNSMFATIFGGTSQPTSPRGNATVVNDKLNSAMAKRLIELYKADQQEKNADQMELDFGAGYEWAPAQLVLARDSRLVIVSEASQLGNRYHTLNVSWRYTIGVGPTAPAAEVRVAAAIAVYLNDNPQLVIDAATDVIKEAIAPVVEEAEERRIDTLSPDNAAEPINRILGWGGIPELPVDDQQTPEGERMSAMGKWFGDNFERMSDIEKFVSWRYYFYPVLDRTFRVFGGSAQILTEPGPNLGKPRNFEDQVIQQLIKQGAPSQVVHARRARTESVESQIHRISDLLTEVDKSYDLRIYAMTVGANVSRQYGGTEAETAAEIRGIDGVTTVRPVPAGKRRLTPHNEYIPFEIKFELVGAVSRVKYRDSILFPGLRRIKGLEIVDWSSMHRINRKGTVRTVREAKKSPVTSALIEAGPNDYGGSMGGIGGGMAGATVQTPTPARETPAPTIEELIADWAEGGVQLYDAPTDTTDMAYHVMMPVDELWKYSSTYYRGDKPMFDGAYQDFIRNGATAPVFLAIGKNGRAKITGNEDILWYAKKSGLQEVPVFISYQRQV